MYILRAHAAGILYAPPPFYTPPTPRRVFSGVGGVGVYKIRARKNLQGLESWVWLPKFCRTFGVLCEGSSAGFLLCERICRTLL